MTYPGWVFNHSGWQYPKVYVGLIVQNFPPEESCVVDLQKGLQTKCAKTELSMELVFNAFLFSQIKIMYSCSNSYYTYKLS